MYILPNSSLRNWHVEYDYKAFSRRLDAFDQWCVRCIVHIPYTAHITNEEVRRRTGQPPVTSVIAKRRLRLFGHLARADTSQHHSRILWAAINRPPADWRRRAGRPRQTWLCTIELDLRPHNLVLNTVWMRAQDCSKWWRILRRYFGSLIGGYRRSIRVSSEDLESLWKA